MAASVGWKMEESGLGILLLLTINCLLPFAVFGYIIVPLDAVAGPLVGKMSNAPPLFIELACGLLAYLHCLPALLSLSPFFSHEGNDGPFFPSSSILSVSSELLFF